MNSNYVSILDEDLKSIIEKLIFIEIKDSEKNEKEISELEKLKKKEGNFEKKKEIQQKIEKLEKETIPYWYKELMKKLNEKLKNISISELDEEEFIKPQGPTEAIAKGLQFKRTQLRKYFNEIKSMKISFQNSKKNDKEIGIKIISLIPKLAYAASKSRNLIDEDFYQFMKIFLEKLREELTYENFKKFEQIFEAIIAYHTYHHPKED